METTTDRWFPSQTGQLSSYYASVAMSRHHHELCNGVVNFENISVQLPSYPQVSSIQFLDSLDKKNICGLPYGNFIVMEDEKMLLSSGIYEKYFSDKQKKTKKQQKKNQPKHFKQWQYFINNLEGWMKRFVWW